MSFFFKRTSQQNSERDVISHKAQSTGPVLQPPFNETGTILGINGKLLHGFLAGVVAYVIWPDDPKWWGLGMFSGILWVASVCFMFEGFRSFLKLRNAKQRWAVIEELGSRPKNARVAGKSDLQNKGMN
jgi:hypothetical protein